MTYFTHGQQKEPQSANQSQQPDPPGMRDLRRSFKDDFLASLVVFLVALPLCMGIAIASGIPAERAAATGIITGIIAGLVVGWLSGSPLQVSGPAAGVSVLILELISSKRAEFLATQSNLSEPGGAGQQALQSQATEYALAALGVVVLLAGLIQLVAGLLGWGRWFRAVSPAVIQGMLAGIGVLIFSSQFHVMIDDSPKEDGGLGNLLSIPEAIWKAIAPEQGYNSVHFQAACIGVLTIMTMVLWKSFGPYRLKFLPTPLIGVLVGTAATILGGLTIQRLSMLGGLVEAIRIPTPAIVQEVWDWSLVVSAVTLAFIASAATLLCATAVDQMHSGPRTQYDRELAAQGIGNTLCGLLGVLPMSGVIVRSAANVEAGAKTRLSAILHGVWLLLFASTLPFVLALIPIATLAAVLVYTGWKLMNVQTIRNLWRYGKSEVIIYAATVVGIVSFDLLKGVLIGVGLSIAKLVYNFSHLSIQVEEDQVGKQTVLRLYGAATFIRLPILAEALEGIPPTRELHVHFEKLRYIDHACLELLMNWERQHRDQGGRLVMDWDRLAAKFKLPDEEEVSRPRESFPVKRTGKRNPDLAVAGKEKRIQR